MAKTITPGVILFIRGQEVPLSPNNYSDVAGAGISFSLVHPVELGTPGDLAAFVSDAFGAGGTLPNFGNLPGPLSDIANRIATLDISVEEFDLYVAPSKDKDGKDIPDASRAPNTYTVGLSGTWVGNPISIFGDALQVKGLFLKIVEDGTPAKT